MRRGNIYKENKSRQLFKAPPGMRDKNRFINI